jgi:2-phosphosulfolactate phosphatase
VLIGSFVNRRTLLNLLNDTTNVHLLCAGTNGQVTREDVLFAGCAVADLCNDGRPEHELNDSARIADDIWQLLAQSMPAEQESDCIDAVASSLKRTQGGRNLKALGLEGDIDTAAQLDRFSIVPELDLSAWRIRL